jgi:hypothetical protein
LSLGFGKSFLSGASIMSAPAGGGASESAAIITPKASPIASFDLIDTSPDKRPA